MKWLPCCHVPTSLYPNKLMTQRRWSLIHIRLYITGLVLSDKTWRRWWWGWWCQWFCSWWWWWCCSSQIGPDGALQRLFANWQQLSDRKHVSDTSFKYNLVITTSFLVFCCFFLASKCRNRHCLCLLCLLVLLKQHQKLAFLTFPDKNWERWWRGFANYNALAVIAKTYLQNTHWGDWLKSWSVECACVHAWGVCMYGRVRACWCCMLLSTSFFKGMVSLFLPTEMLSWEWVLEI